MDPTMYQCPKCHNVLPKNNKMMHDIRCTESNPVPLNNSRRNIDINQSQPVNTHNVNQNQNHPHSQQPIRPVNNQNYQNINIPMQQHQNNQPFQPQAPSVPHTQFTCNICGLKIDQKEKDDHLLCHQLEDQDLQQQQEQRGGDVGCVGGGFTYNTNNPEGLSKREERCIDINGNVKIITRYLDRNGREVKREERSEQSRVNHPIVNSNRNNNNYNRNQNESHVTTSVDQDGNTIETRTETLPNGTREITVRSFDSSGREISRQVQVIGGAPGGFSQTSFSFGGNNFNNNNAFNMSLGMNAEDDDFNMNDTELRRFNPNMGVPVFGGPQGGFFERRYRPVPFNGNLMELFRELIPGMFGRRDNPTDTQVLNELPETEITDPTKLSEAKKNCIICLEDFKSGDKATILPCLHIFHTQCVKDWLHTQNTCPICKFKLTMENIENQYHQ